MSAPITIILPTLNAADRIGPCLGAIGQGLFEGLIREVILADGGSQDAIGEIADATGATLIQTERGRGSQLAAGARAATGAEWLLFLHADTILATDWPQKVLEHVQTNPGRAACFRLRLDSDAGAARLVERWANARTRLLSLPYGDQGLLISRKLYDEVGGFQPIPLMEDVAIARRLGRRRIRMLDCTATTSAERYERDGWLRRGTRNLSTLALYLMGRSPQALVQRYEKN
ncbi:MAG: TIGR04283 family arsenosugar biosynthesis glycosyltransferase [Pseudomonadota bacterium]